jgi:hypothetical protein
MRAQFAALVTIASLSAACGSSTVRNEGAVGKLPPPPTPESTLVPRAELPRPRVDVWQPRGTKQALDALQRAAGGTLLMTELVLYPEYAIMQARDPRQRQNVDRYVFRAGAVAEPSPVMLVGSVDLDAETFTREQVAFGEITRLVRDARTQIGVEGARTTHVIIERDTVFAGGEIVVRVYAGTERRSGYVEYDARGNLRRVVA